MGTPHLPATGPLRLRETKARMSYPPIRPPSGGTQSQAAPTPSVAGATAGSGRPAVPEGGAGPKTVADHR